MESRITILETHFLPGYEVPESLLPGQVLLQEPALGDF